MDFSKFIKNLPDAPGIYMFYDKTAALIYVGKATSLRNRVRSYFNPHHSPSLTSGRSGVGLRPIVQMMHRVADIRFVQTDSVLEAIILEANHIKKYQPIYNVDGKDDKSWNYIGITRDEYPRVVTIREHELERLKHESIKTLKQWGYVFGPYPGMNTKATMKILRRLFRFSSCVPGAERPCVYYQMGQCLGVCVGEIFSAEYKKRVIQPLTLFLRGKKKLLVKNLEIRMKKLAKAQEYEDAAGLRDQIDRLQHIQDVALLNKSFVEDESRFTNHDLRFTRIEGYDISNLGPTGVVGSMVIFSQGEPDKSQYRRFRIRSFEGQSDVDALAEVIERRLRHAPSPLGEGKGEDWPLPDLFLIDGGKPQINRVQEIFNTHGIKIPVIGIMKGPERKRNDIIFAVRPSPDLIRWADDHRILLIRIRDEAHRFAIRYQRKTREIKRGIIKRSV